MIKYDETKRVFHLTNGSISYYIYVNSVGVLETLYFGEHLEDIGEVAGIAGANIDNCSTQYFDKKEGVEKSFDDNYKATYARKEVSSHALIDKRGAPIIIEKKNGSYETDFRFSSYKIIDGVPSLKTLPSIRNADGSTLEVTLKDVNYDVELIYRISILDKNDIIIKNFEIINHEKEDITIKRAYSLELDLPSCHYDFTHFRGRWSKERDKKTNEVMDGYQAVSSNYGRSSHEENPFVYLENKDNNEVIGFNLIYSSNFTFSLFSDYMGGLRVLYGINDEDFSWKLKTDESFETPQAVISYSYQGVDKMSQNFHKVIKENIIGYKKEKEYKPILFNSWEGCYMDFDTEKILSFVDASKKIGAELFVLDDGWFSNRDTDYTGLGDWWINEKKIDLQKVIDQCHKNKMKFGIWYEPEMVNPGTELFKKHPEYALGNYQDKMIISRHQFHLDFTSDEVIENIFNQMVDVLDKYAVDYVKWDYNRVVYEHMSTLLSNEEQGRVYHLLALGYYKLLEKLTKKYPDIMFEGCASGGGRFDLGTLYYCPQIWCSDESDPVQRFFIQYNTSLGYPLSTIGSHANNNNLTSYKIKAELALFGTYGYEMNPKLLTEDEINELNEVADVYKKYHKEVIEEGTLYHLCDPNKSNYMSMMAVSSNKNTAMVFFTNLLKELDQYRFLKLKGLDPNKYYRNNLDSRVYSGDYYMKIGLNLSRFWLWEFNSKLIILNAI